MFIVYSYCAKDGKTMSQVKGWLRERGEPYWKGIPGVKSVKSYHRVMGLGQRPVFQTFIEVPDFAFLDKYSSEPERRKVFREFFEFFTDFNATIMIKLE